MISWRLSPIDGNGLSATGSFATALASASTPYFGLASYNGGSMVGGGFDNLTYGTLPTPKPGALVLLATGLIGLLAYAWRKRK